MPIEVDEAMELADARPQPKPRKRITLWQAYLWTSELIELRKKHRQRIAAAKAGKSNFDVELEQELLDQAGLDALIKYYDRRMIAIAKETVPEELWAWVTSLWSQIGRAHV